MDIVCLLTVSPGQRLDVVLTLISAGIIIISTHFQPLQSAREIWSNLHRFRQICEQYLREIITLCPQNIFQVFEFISWQIGAKTKCFCMKSDCAVVSLGTEPHIASGGGVQCSAAEPPVWVRVWKALWTFKVEKRYRSTQHLPSVLLSFSLNLHLCNLSSPDSSLEKLHPLVGPLEQRRKQQLRHKTSTRLFTNHYRSDEESTDLLPSHRQPACFPVRLQSWKTTDTPHLSVLEEQENPQICLKVEAKIAINKYESKMFCLFLWVSRGQISEL